MVTVQDIIKVIQKIDITNNKMKFLISLANGWYRFGQLTEKQESAFYRAVEELQEGGDL